MAKLGWGEFVVILIIALLVLGPDKLPQAGRALGKAVRGVKKFVREATEELELDEIKDIKSDVEGIRKDLRTMGSDLEKSVTEEAEKLESDMKTAEAELNAAVNEPPRPKAVEQPAPAETPAPAPEEIIEQEEDPS